jgi:methylglyoxal synthase
MPPVKPAPWPDPAHVPAEGQEIVILIAAQAMRQGPASQLARLVREFAPYWRATGAMIYALEGSYRAVWRAGLLHDYKNFAPLPAGFDGGLVYATEIVIAAAEASRQLTAHVVFLIDPHEDSSLYPATSSLKRECLLTKTAFLTNYQGAARWFRLEWARRVADGQGPTAKDLLVRKPSKGFSKSSGLAHRPRVLALAAHDRHKRAMMDFADTYADLFERHYGKRWATRVTGHLLNGGSIFDEEYAEDILYDVKGQKREDLKALIEEKTFAWEEAEREDGPGTVEWAQQLTRGRQGGVIQLARKVLGNECDTILFFQDAESPREHDMEIQVLDRAAEMADNHCLLIYDDQSAARWADNVSICLDGEDAPGATTLVEAYRRVFKVELVLAEPDSADEEDDKATWRQITRTAATYVVGALRAAKRERAEEGEPVRLGLPWGGAVYDVLGAVDEDRKQTSEEDGDKDEFERVLAGALGLHEFVDQNKDVKDLHEDRGAALRAGEWPPAPKALHPFGEGDLRIVPTVGVIGARDRSLESYSLVDRAVKILGGEGITYPASAFALRQDARDDPLCEPPHEDWRRLDVLLLSAAPMQPDRSGVALATALPADLAESYADCLGAISTIYLEESAGGVAQREHHSYRQVGIKLEQIRKLRKEGDANIVLVNGAEKNEDRRKACWAALKARIATTFVTDKDFAWTVLKEEIPELRRTSDKGY